MVHNDRLLMGIDGGGTGCRAVLCDSCGRRLGSGDSGTANIMTDPENARTNIVDAATKALDASGLGSNGLGEISAVLGLAGANIGEYGSRLSPRLPFKQSVMETDARISLEGAVGPNDGVVAIIGTGSIFVYRREGVIRTAGGWGFMVGDLGSGAWLGRNLLQEVLLSYDGIHTGSALTDKILTDFENDPQTVVEYAYTAKPGEFGAFAPDIFEFADRRDPIAQKIVRRAVSDIEETLDAILLPENSRFCFLGGLGPVYGNVLGKYYRDRVEPPLGDAVSGAIRLGHRQLRRLVRRQCLKT